MCSGSMAGFIRCYHRCKSVAVVGEVAGGDYEDLPGVAAGLLAPVTLTI